MQEKHPALYGNSSSASPSCSASAVNPMQPPREQIAASAPVVVPPPPITLLLTPKEATPQPPTPIAPQLPTPTPVKLFQPPPTPIRSSNESDKLVSEQPIVPKATKAKSTPVKHVPCCSTRNRSAPVRLGYDGQQGHGCNAEFNGTSLKWLYNEKSPCVFHDLPRHTRQVSAILTL